MEQLNKVELVGVVGNVRVQTYDDKKMARVGLATNYCYKDIDGAVVIDTSWHCLIIWEGGKDICDLSKLTKGSKLHVIGRLRYQNYTGVDGVDRITTDILVSKAEIVDDPNPLGFECDADLKR